MQHAVKQKEESVAISETDSDSGSKVPPDEVLNYGCTIFGRFIN